MSVKDWRRHFMTAVAAALALHSLCGADTAELERLAAFALEAPPVYALPHVPERYSQEHEKFVMNNGTAVTPGGRIWVSWVGGEDSDEAYTLCAFSDDGGASWRNPALVVDGHIPGAKVPRSNIIANLWCDPKGVLHLFFSQSCWHNDGRMGVWEISCEDPDSPAPHWSAPRRLSDGAALNKPIVLSNGTWLLPVEIARPYGQWARCFRKAGQPAIATLLASTDDGATWQRRGDVNVENCWWPENHVVELKDGRLRMYMRSLKGLRMAESGDGGRTWGGVFKPIGIDQVVSRCQIRKLKSGNWLFIRHQGGIDSFTPYDNDKDRNGIYVYLSQDEGRTWKGELVLDHSASVSYPDLEEDASGRLYVSHDFERQRDAEIRLHVFREEDVIAGKIISSDARLGMIVTRATGSKFNRQHRFAHAVPVWPDGREKERNGFFGFRGDFVVGADSDARVRITASTYYRVWINGRFLGHGPVRAPHGFFRVDDWKVGELAHSGTNAIAVEVSNYNEWSQCIVGRQDGFLQCEVTDRGRVLASTGRDFIWLDLPRVRNVSRFSKQRASHEVYRLSADWDAWRTAPSVKGKFPAVHPPVRLLDRVNAYPDFKLRQAALAVDTDFEFDVSGNPHHRASEGLAYDPYVKPELVHPMFDGWAEFSRVTRVQTAGRKTDCPADIFLGRGVIADFGRVHSGFLALDISCDEPCKVYAITDETLTDGHPNPLKRFGHATGSVWEFTQPGRYRVLAFEPCGIRYVHLFAREGSARVNAVTLREYENPGAFVAKFESSDIVLNRIFDAARETCAQNTMDATLDCVTRERNSGPNDSLYTTGAYRLLSGSHCVERAFFQNYAIADRYPDIPEPMLPAYFPADPPRHPYGIIANYAMWFIIQLDRYVAETGDGMTRDLLRKRVLDVVNRFRGCRNREGLLENLPGCIFFEWSEASGFTRGVHHPTSMLWAETLDAVARLYGTKELAAEAESVREAVRRVSWSGKWFRDHSVRNEKGELVTPEDISETCQYFAFRFGVATPQTHPDLWMRVVDGFGRGKCLAGVKKSDLFPGYMMRYACLSRAGLHRKVLSDIRDLNDMADMTGTFWEALPGAGPYSCSQGFTGYIATYLMRSALGVGEIDYSGKTVELSVPDNGLEFCRGTVPTPDGDIRYAWTNRDGVVHEEITLPKGWTREGVRRIPDT